MGCAILHMLFALRKVQSSAVEPRFRSCRTIALHPIDRLNPCTRPAAGAKETTVSEITKAIEDDSVLQPPADVATEPTGAQAFEVLLHSLKRARRVVEPPLPDTRRAARYAAQLPVQYRWQEDKAWFSGMTENISSTGLLLALDYADSRISRDRPTPPDNPLRLAIEIRPTPDSQLPASISCSARHVRTTVAPGRVVLNAIGVNVDTWQLGTAPY